MRTVDSATMSGTIASSGYAYGQAFLFREMPMVLSQESITAEQCESERRLLHRSLQAVRGQLNELQEKAESILDAGTLALFQSYQLLLEDEEFIQAIEDCISLEAASAAWAVHQVMEQHAEAMSRLESLYLRERATDIRDLKQRVIRNLLGSTSETLPDLTDRILVAEDLSPAQSVQLNLQSLQGLLTDRGGVTSHTSILARALNIPAIVGTRQATQLIRDCDWILMDAVTNKVWVNPEPGLVEAYQISRHAHREEQQKLAGLVHHRAMTQDGHRIHLAANIGLPGEISRARSAGAEGIGLFRTEFLFMNRTDLPDEEEQFASYKTVLEQMSPHPVIVRTMDIGGDKDLPHLNLSKEDNPFLGMRGIRISLRRPEWLLTQLRALLRASPFGSLKIMFPMVSCLEEIIDAHRVLEQAREELQYFEKVDVGIMIETPSSAMIATHLIRHVDFFSIGTNDLTQYTLAVDRGHTEIRELYQPLSPAVLQLMKKAIDAAVHAGKQVGVCGELAGEPMAALLLAGMGATELSMSAGSIGRVKQILMKTHWSDLQEWAEKALLCATAVEVKTLLDAWETRLHF